MEARQKRFLFFQMKYVIFVSRGLSLGNSFSSHLVQSGRSFRNVPGLESAGNFPERCSSETGTGATAGVEPRLARRPTGTARLMRGPSLTRGRRLRRGQTARPETDVRFRKVFEDERKGEPVVTNSC